jgi:hypothetical protein
MVKIEQTFFTGRTSCLRDDLMIADLVEEFSSTRGTKFAFGVRSHHHKVDLAILEAIARQTIPRHFLQPDPVLAEIAGSLVLRLKFRLQAAGVARSTVCDLKKDRLLSFFEVRFWRGMTHRLFLCERLTGPIFEMRQQCPICAALL